MKYNSFFPKDNNNNNYTQLRNLFPAYIVAARKQHVTGTIVSKYYDILQVCCVFFFCLSFVLTVNLSMYSVVNIGFEPILYTVNENSRVVEFVIQNRNPNLQKDVTITFNTIDGSAKGRHAYLYIFKVRRKNY